MITKKLNDRTNVCMNEKKIFWKKIFAKKKLKRKRKKKLIFHKSQKNPYKIKFSSPFLEKKNI